jgi:hypothetical protein
VSIFHRRKFVWKKSAAVVIMMETFFPKSIYFEIKYSRLLKIVRASDTLGFLINAEPDNMASAMALKRIF